MPCGGACWLSFERETTIPHARRTHLVAPTRPATENPAAASAHDEARIVVTNSSWGYRADSVAGSVPVAAGG